MKPAPPKKTPPDLRDETMVSTKIKTKIDWRDEPPPVRAETPETPEIVAESDATDGQILVSQPFAPPTRIHNRVIDWKLVRELAYHSDEATSNLGTLDSVINRVELTRRLLHRWDKLGKHLHAVTKKAPPKESEQFAARLEQIGALMQEYPAFLGQPGKPGYRVIVQARLKIPLLITRAMTDDQRTELLFDWQAGRQVLLAHRRYLLTVFKSMRHRTMFGLMLHAIRSTLNDYPWLTLLGVLLLVVLIVVTVVKLYR
jgi:hypothetical protein